MASVLNTGASGLMADIAISQIGTLEEGGNNLGPKVRQYQEATGLRPIGDWPWCAAFVCWCFREAYGDVAWRPKTARAFGFEAWGLANGLKVLPEAAACKVGDIVVFDMSHVGIIVADAPEGAKFFEAVEGNTGSAGLRDSATGDGVWRKKRHRSLARSFVRLERS